MTAIAIIPARGGSTRIPRKNIRDFRGKPIIAYSIITARKCGLFDRIIVSTEDKEIANVALEYGAEVRWRPYDLADNCVGTQAVAAYVCREQIGAEPGPKPEYVCVIYATAPLMDVFTLRKGLTLLKSHQGPATSRYQEQHGKLFARATHLGQDVGQFYWGRYIDFLMNADQLEARAIDVPVFPQRACDINTEADWQRAEKMFDILEVELQAWKRRQISGVANSGTSTSSATGSTGRSGFPSGNRSKP
jgi:pseudaminic acid cytidylyltransferase